MKKDVIERIIDKLEDHEDIEVYACDLAYTLFESENIDGTFTYNSYKAKEWIKENFDDIGEIWEELQFQFDKDFLAQFNMFDNPEKFMVLIILESAGYILNKCKFIEENWNDKIILNKKTIKTLKKQLEELDDGNSIL